MERQPLKPSLTSSVTYYTKEFARIVLSTIEMCYIERHECYCDFGNDLGVLLARRIVCPPSIPCQDRDNPPKRNSANANTSTVISVPPVATGAQFADVVRFHQTLVPKTIRATPTSIPTSAGRLYYCTEILFLCATIWVRGTNVSLGCTKLGRSSLRNEMEV